MPEIRDLGRADYEETRRLQRALLQERREALLLVEHPPVYTRGTSARGGPAPALPHPVLDVERGGGVTYHGPGVLVGYPILDLRARGLLPGTWLRRIEGLLISALARLGLPGERVPGLTGVWSKGLKVASIGIAVSGWRSWHGFALNVDCDLGPFRAIRPCGLDPDRVGSLSSLLGRRVALAEAKAAVRSAFAEALWYNPSR